MPVGYLYKLVKITRCAKEMINNADLFVIHETQNPHAAPFESVSSLRGGRMRGRDEAG